MSKLLRNFAKVAKFRQIWSHWKWPPSLDVNILISVRLVRSYPTFVEVIQPRQSAWKSTSSQTFVCSMFDQTIPAPKNTFVVAPSSARERECVFWRTNLVCLDSSFNIWPFTTMQICPIAWKCAKVGSNFCKITIYHSKICQGGIILQIWSHFLGHRPKMLS